MIILNAHFKQICKSIHKRTKSLSIDDDDDDDDDSDGGCSALVVQATMAIVTVAVIVIMVGDDGGTAPAAAHGYRLYICIDCPLLHRRKMPIVLNDPFPSEALKRMETATRFPWQGPDERSPKSKPTFESTAIYSLPSLVALIIHNYCGQGAMSGTGTAEFSTPQLVTVLISVTGQTARPPARMFYGRRGYTVRDLHAHCI